MQASSSVRLHRATSLNHPASGAIHSAAGGLRAVNGFFPNLRYPHLIRFKENREEEISDKSAYVLIKGMPRTCLGMQKNTEMSR
jgi:hypothetical protein